MNDWNREAVCTADPEAWFPDDQGGINAAKAWCRVCPLLADCRTATVKSDRELGRGSIHGVQGGLSTAERLSILRRGVIRTPVTHCPRGHDYSEPGVARPNGRGCRVCARINDAARRLARKQRKEAAA